MVRLSYKDFCKSIEIVFETKMHLITDLSKGIRTNKIIALKNDWYVMGDFNDIQEWTLIKINDERYPFSIIKDGRNDLDCIEKLALHFKGE